MEAPCERAMNFEMKEDAGAVVTLRVVGGEIGAGSG